MRYMCGPSRGCSGNKRLTAREFSCAVLRRAMANAMAVAMAVVAAATVAAMAVAMVAAMAGAMRGPAQVGC